MDFCLDIKDGIYKLGDLNLFTKNKAHFSYPETDLMNPEKPFFTGTLNMQVETSWGDRTFGVYIPKNYPISGAGIFLVPDSGIRAKEVLADPVWISYAEEFQVSLIVLESEAEGWNKRNIQKEVKYCEEVFKKAISRTHFSMNEATYYLMGLGEGAYIASVYGILNSSIFSVLLLDGDTELHPDLLAQLQTIQSDRDAQKYKTDVMMPAWIVDYTDRHNALLELLKKASSCENRGLQTKFAKVFQTDVQKWQNTPDGLPITEVLYTESDLADELDSLELHKEMIRFALRFKRWLAIGNGDFRPARSAEDMGLEKITKVIDGRLRQWHIYEPSAYRRDKEEKRPLVLAIHGYSCTGPLFAENSEWHSVAESRDFFLVYVSAFPSNINQSGKSVPLPTWNTKQMISETDDVGYIREVLKDIQNRYPVDPERIYCSGHSNGSFMTQRLMEEMPEVFAAFCPAGAQYHMNISPVSENMQREIPVDGIIRPVWLVMGHEDIGDADDLSEGNSNDRFIDMMCQVNSLEREAGSCLKNGKYTTYTYADREKTPLLKFTGVMDLPHAYTPELARMYYDEFMCHFRRKADGTIQYFM